MSPITVESDSDDFSGETPASMYDYNPDHIARVTRRFSRSNNSVISELEPGINTLRGTMSNAGTEHSDNRMRLPSGLSDMLGGYSELSQDDMKSPFEAMACIENYGNSDAIFSKVYFNSQSDYATAPLHLRQYARSVEYLVSRHCREFTDSRGNVVMSNCIIKLDFSLNTRPSHVLFPPCELPGKMTVRFYCVCIDHMSIPLGVLNQTVESHTPEGRFLFPQNISRFGTNQIDTDRNCYAFLDDPMGVGVVYTSIPHVPVFPTNDQPFLILWLNLYLFFNITVTSALPHDGTLAVPMIQATGYCATHMEYGWCPVECIPFALETRHLTRPHMIDLVVDPPLACYMVIQLRVQCARLDQQSKELLRLDHQNVVTWWFCPIHTNKIVIACPPLSRQLRAYDTSIDEPPHHFLEFPVQESRSKRHRDQRLGGQSWSQFIPNISYSDNSRENCVECEVISSLPSTALGSTELTGCVATVEFPPCLSRVLEDNQSVWHEHNTNLVIWDPVTGNSPSVPITRRHYLSNLEHSFCP